MPDLGVAGLPGIRAPRTATPRQILRGGEYTFLAQGRTINGTASRNWLNSPDIAVLQAGLLMGKITATGLYATSILGVTSGAYTSGGTSLTVSAAAATEIVRRVGSSGTATLNVVGPPTAAGTNAVTACTYSAVNTTTGVITITSLGVDKIAGSFVTAADGSQLPLSFIPDEWAIKVVDLDGNSVASVPWSHVPIAGELHSANLLNWPSDTSIQGWIVANLNGAASGQFIFDHAL